MARSGEDEDTEARDEEPAAAQGATGSGRGPVLRAGGLRILRIHPRGRGRGGAGAGRGAGSPQADERPPVPPLAFWTLAAWPGVSVWAHALLALTTYSNSTNKVTSPLFLLLSVAQSSPADLGGVEKRDFHCTSLRKWLRLGKVV